MIPATQEEQRTLLDLQQVDTAIRKLEHRRANLPEQRALDENTLTLRKVASEHAIAREELDQLERDQKRLEDEIGMVESRRKSEEGRMYSGLITSEKEVEALRSELSSLKTRKHDLEDVLLEKMERIEELTSMLAALKERHAELTGKVEELAAARDEAATGIDAELTGRREERERAASSVDDEILSYYEDLRGRKAGLAVAELSGKTCQGCRLQLTQIELEETRDAVKRGLAKCPQCDRILVLAR